MYAVYNPMERFEIDGEEHVGRFICLEELND